MTPEEWKTLRKLAVKATAGPWSQHLVDDTTVISADAEVCHTTPPLFGIDVDVDFTTDVEQCERDAAFIAAANPTIVLALLDEMERLTRERDEARADYARRHTDAADFYEKLIVMKAENERMRAALIRLRDCDLVFSLPDRMDAVREIAREALK